MADRYTGNGVGAPIPRDWGYARTPEERDARRRERHRRWIAALTDRDWTRLRLMADEVLSGQKHSRIEDLDAPIHVGVYSPTKAHLPNGERFGTLRGCILMAWDKD